MDLRLAVLTLVLVWSAETRNIFTPRYGPLMTDENSLTPLYKSGGNSHLDLKKDWVNAHHVHGGTTTVVAGSRLELECDSVGGPMPQAAWQKGDMPVTAEMENDNMIRGFGLGKVVTRYIVDCVAPEDEGEYSCKAHSGGIETSTETTTVVVEGSDSALLNNGVCPTQIAPRFTMFSPMTLQNIGNSVRVPCRAHGIPRPRVFWTKDGKLVEHPRFKFHVNGDMEIHNLVWADLGTYTCVAENTHGKESTSTFIYPMKT